MPEIYPGWPSAIPGETVPPTSAEILAVEVALESARRHSEGGIDDMIWMELPIPVLQASEDPDIRHLRGLIEDGRFPSTCISVGPLSHMRWQSALNCAIERHLVTHAQLLVETGAAVDGYPLWCFSTAASRFFRGRPHQFTLAGGDQLSEIVSTSHPTSIADDRPSSQLQLGPTPSELTSRRASQSRFWAESDFPRFDYPAATAEHSLSVAVKAGDADLYKFLVAHGADESAWLTQTTSLRESFVASNLASISPLATAVSRQDPTMLRFLLDRHHKPDIFSIVTPTRALNPVMQSIAGITPWLEGLSMMLPLADIEKRTPVFNVHALHIAVATLNLVVVERVQSSLGGGFNCGVSPTALGHTLLHIACLPFDNTLINMSATPVVDSAREFRTLAAEWKSQGYRSAQNDHSSAQFLRRGPRGRTPSRRPDNVPRSDRPSSHTQEAKYQVDMVKYLLSMYDNVKAELVKTDVHGNTPLHYLAMMRNMDLYTALIYQLVAITRDVVGDDTFAMEDMLCSSPFQVGAESSDTWSCAKNYWGYTPQELYKSNIEAGVDYTEDHVQVPFWQNELRQSGQRIH